jgi:transposase
MKRFVQGQERSQRTLFPACLDEYISDDNPVRVIDVFVEELDLRALGFGSVIPQVTGRPAYHPAALLKISIYGYLNRIPSSRRLEQERCACGGRRWSIHSGRSRPGWEPRTF